MIDALSQRQRRVLAVATLVLFVALVIAATVLPLWLTNRHYQQDIATLETRLQKLQRLALAGDTLRPQYEQLQRWQASDVRYLQSANESLAAAELQRVVKRIVTAHRAEVLSTQIVPPAQEQGFTRVTLKVRLRGTLESLLSVFYSIETDKLFLFLNKVSIRALGARYQQRNIVTRQNLDVDFELIGYMPRRP